MTLAMFRPIDGPATGASSRAVLRNGILAQLPPDILAEVAMLSHRVELKPGEKLFGANDAHPSLYFPSTGAIGLIGVLPTRETLQIALVDCSGVVGISGHDGQSRMPCEAIVQLPGSATCIPFEAFARLQQDPTTANVLCSYVYGLSIDAVQAALCHTFHTVEQRCALWLLKLCDVAGPEFFVTQEQLSGMLGVRRASVSEAALAFQSGGAIDYRYGHMVVRDRARLQQSACTCYQTPRQKASEAAPEAI